MGMFDWVNFEMNCPNCGTLVKYFQSKNGYCVGEKISPEKIYNMYSSCHKCKTWIELEREYVEEEPLPERQPFTLEEVKAMGFKLKKRRINND